MIAFRCAHCDKDLKVKDKLTGKKVRCPGCGNAVAVPESTVVKATGQMQQGMLRSADEITLPPRSPQGADERTLLPAKQAAHDSLPDSDEQTDLGGQKGEATQTYATDEAHAELTAFLAPAEAADELGRLGGFRILKVLGHGGMGVVFQGEDPKLGRKVAIKAMLPHLSGSKSSQERFLREARAAAALEHDHIVPILQVGEDRGAPFIVMPFLQGEPLDQRLKGDTALPINEILRIGRETAEGLAAAHQRGLIHRDIKPANLWLEGDRGRVKILDFGLARAGGETGLTQTGAIIGTPQYMAPEQAAGRKNLDQRCDLFSLGCVLYRMCTGQLPFKGDDTLAIISALAMDTPEPPSELCEVPQPLSDLVMQLLAKKPEDRPQSAQAVVEAIQELESFSGEPKATGQGTRKMKVAGKTRTEAAPTQIDTAGKRRLPKSWLAGGGVVAVGVLGLIVFFLVRQEQPDIGSTQSEPLPAAFTNNLGMEFVLVPKGKSWLGGGGGKPGAKGVEVFSDFYLGKYEVTQEEWEKVTGQNPSRFKVVPGAAKEDLKRYPVETVSWHDARKFIDQLNSQVKDKGWTYRLPTEAEWEYACRGGPMADKSNSAFDFYLEKPTNQLSPDQANFGNKSTCKVGSYNPNRLGLFDMHGNVWEWCEDEVPDPNNPNGALLRLSRGGAWDSHRDAGMSCRAAHRTTRAPSYRPTDVGLRLARVPVGKEIAKLITPPEKKSPVVEAKLPPTFKNTLGMEFVLVPKGKSWLGGGNGKPGDKEVEVLEDFYLGKYEVTQQEWEKLTAKRPSYFSRTGVGKDSVKDVSDSDLERFPVESVSWEDCQRIVSQINQPALNPVVEGQQRWTYRLPTELEWEYACRGGPMKDMRESEFDFYLDKPATQLQPAQANFGNGLKRTCKVGNYPPNKLGLFDMHGNVWEWCDDEEKVDQGAAQRIGRSGGWSLDAGFCRAAHRGPNAPSGRNNVLGVRLARVPVGKQIVKIIAPEEKKPTIETKPPQTFKNSLGMDFVLVPKGKSWLGGGSAEPGDKEVEIVQDFYLGKYEVTQEEWEKVMGSVPSWFCRAGGGKDAVKDIPEADLQRFPVETVSWDDAQFFLAKLNKQDKQEGWVYRLPKEAEWEYACRGGPMTENLDSAFDFYFDRPVAQLRAKQANFDPKGLKRTCKVGSYKPNKLGLYDMHGNVWEWCDDELKRENEALVRVVRGGSYSNGAGGCRAAVHGVHPPSHRRHHLGLRLARVPIGKEIVKISTAAEKPTAVDPERRAATMLNPFATLTLVLKDGKAVEIGRGQPLPEQSFHLSSVFIGIDIPERSQFVSRTLLPAVANVSRLSGISAAEPLVPISEVDLERLTSIPGASTLTSLILDVPVSNRTFELLARFPALNYIGLRLEKADADKLKLLTKLRALKALALGGSSEVQVKSSLAAALTGLTLDSIGFIGAKGIDSGAIAVLAKMDGLEHLSFYRVNLKDEQAAELSRFSKLRSLYVKRNQLTDGVLGSFSKLQHLERLAIQGNRVTKDVVLKLAAALPRCKIEWDGGLIGPRLLPEFKNTLGMEFVLVPKGKSWLGGGGSKPGDKEVEVLHDFYLGKYEVTQEEWQKITGVNPSKFQAAPGTKEDMSRFPVESISWDDAQSFLKLLNSRAKDEGWIYRLPREVEWEYACRGGPLTNRQDSAFDFYLERPTNTFISGANLDAAGLKRPCKVGSYKANALGLHDMHGNVWEWCADVVPDSRQPTKGSLRLGRGGGWGNIAANCAAAFRNLVPASTKNGNLGLRVARVRASKEIVKHAQEPRTQ